MAQLAIVLFYKGSYCQRIDLDYITNSSIY
jgi:hypothetical protein